VKHDLPPLFHGGVATAGLPQHAEWHLSCEVSFDMRRESTTTENGQAQSNLPGTLTIAPSSGGSEARAARVLIIASESAASQFKPQAAQAGIDLHSTSSTLLALGLIADYDPEILWVHATDGELTLEEICDAIRTPRQIHPVALVVSQSTLPANFDCANYRVDEVVPGESCDEMTCIKLMQLVKVTRLERQVIRREHEILDSLPHAMLVVDRRMTLWKVNKQLTKLLEITDSDYRRKALGRHFGAGLAAAGLKIEGDSPLPRLVHEMGQAIRTGKKSFRVKETVGGSDRLFSAEITELIHSPENFLIDLRDITADEQAVLVEARRERLATIGNLSVGVAHEIQNPNTFSRVNAANLKMMFDALKPLVQQASMASGGKLGAMPAETFMKKMSEAIAAVDMASRRIESVLTTLKSFGRQDDGELEAVDIRSVADEAVMLVRHEARGKAEIKLELPETLPEAYGARIGLSQILVNLLQNSLHAFDENKLQARKGGPAEILIRCETCNEEEVILSVSDNGPGVDEQLQEKIFRPYFTTKPQGLGTGLGLSISTDMMHRFGGDLTLKSRAGEGATFYIKLRRHDAVAPDKL
jgi:signal transduction histidine kinase